MGTPGEQPGLSERDREILEFERQWWKYAGAASFDGVNDVVTVPDDAGPPSPGTITVEAWVRPGERLFHQHRPEAVVLKTTARRLARQLRPAASTTDNLVHFFVNPSSTDGRGRLP